MHCKNQSTYDIFRDIIITLLIALLVLLFLYLLTKFYELIKLYSKGSEIIIDESGDARIARSSSIFSEVDKSNIRLEAEAAGVSSADLEGTSTASTEATTGESVLTPNELVKQQTVKELSAEGVLNGEDEINWLITGE